MLRVVRGTPDDAELAALTAVLAAAGGSKPTGEPKQRRSRWADRAALLRRPLHPGPGAWRASGMPR
ncbi:acyl-CoA carboxylase subunit epsilon [Sciscionella sediminilitoris]|uniref:acyl-CoA carboxylase subunit epsilon n=1 Tax=Sciscionella sediminilitoris TaxID=1445613 RepID=UPI000690B44B|nr:acyl-CoA carboxylase subunit epsilon [Sciscionella sp. SE31]